MDEERPISYVPFDEWLNDVNRNPESHPNLRSQPAGATARQRIAALLFALGGRIGGIPPANMPSLQPPDAEQQLET